MKQLIVDYGLLYNRIAILENQTLVELYIEDLNDQSYVGNIYLGKVVNVVKSMSAVFIDIGTGKNAYMPYDDTIKNGMELFVQVTRDPVGEKGATVTTDISISGQYMVLLPKGSEILISKKLDYDEKFQDIKKRIKEKWEFGGIIRTDAKNASFENLEIELHSLIKRWQEIYKQKNRILKERLIHVDYAFEGLIHKEYLPYVDEMILNSKEAYSLFQGENITLYKEPYPIFEHFRVEEQILESLDRYVTLHQGSVITIDETEALTVVDVNSAGFIGSNNKEETFLQVNLAAAKEIARQIRLRNISGIILIDFINMKSKENYKHLQVTLKKYFKMDRSLPKIHGITNLGLMEITRKKNRKSLKTQLLSTCPVCNGAGYYISDTIYYKKFIEKMKILKEHTKNTAFKVYVSDGMLELLSKEIREDISYLEFIEEKLSIDIEVIFDEALEGVSYRTSGK
ncbi:MAG: ribonuclease E/G [Clostridia bacterium]|nr:ribonuclease E/G [Clostridia bacterium]